MAPSQESGVERLGAVAHARDGDTVFVNQAPRGQILYESLDGFELHRVLTAIKFGLAQHSVRRHPRVEGARFGPVDAQDKIPSGSQRVYRRFTADAPPQEAAREILHDDQWIAAAAAIVAGINK